jgi:parallel beta-helix repeat protein
MKLSLCINSVALAFALAGSVFGQGALVPPGPPEPLMKTLDQIEPRYPISTLPFEITNSGSYYIISNLLGAPARPGITIGADNVTLDLGGWTLQGAPNSTSGIVLSNNVRNLVIRNGSVRGWPAHGMNVSGASNARFERLLVTQNGQAGLSAGGASSIINCHATGNGGHGFSALEGSSVSGCVANQNNVGINLAQRCTVSGSTAVGNFSHGIFPSEYCVVRDCTASANGGFGINANFTGCRIQDSSVTTNLAGGITAGTGSTVKGCTVQGNTGSGIIVSTRCTVADNTCDANGNGGTLAGIHATGNGNRIEGNSLTSNNTRGVRVDGTGNLVVKNSARGSTVNYSIAAGNHDARVIAPGAAFINSEPWLNFELP